jgi:hypothetical protein
MRLNSFDRCLRHAAERAGVAPKGLYATWLRSPNRTRHGLFELVALMGHEKVAETFGYVQQGPGGGRSPGRRVQPAASLDRDRRWGRQWGKP